MQSTNDIKLIEFIEALASSSPIPGGGGASALIGAAGAALCSMVANFTTGKQKYAAYQADIDKILQNIDKSISNLFAFIKKDAEAFEPLSRAYSIPKDDHTRNETLEKALASAAGVPMEILRELAGIVDIIEELAEKGSRLAISDVGVAASAIRAAMEGAVMNVYINTKLMKDRTCAERLNREASELLSVGVRRCGAVYDKIIKELTE